MNITVVNAKIWEIETKIPDHVKYITTLEFDKLTAENIAARLKQVNLVSKNDFDNKLISLSRKNTSFRYLTFKYLFRTYFTSIDGSQNPIADQPTLNTLELNKGKITNYFLSWKWKGVYTSKFGHYLLFSCIA